MTAKDSNAKFGDPVGVAVIGTGEMGSAVAKRLLDRGARVKTSLHGRSEASRERIRKLGIPSVESDAALVEGVDIILSIIPPGEAVTTAQQITKVLSSAKQPPIFVDCNAIAPGTAQQIETITDAGGVPFVDGGIVGSAPRDNYAGPMIFVSGSQAGRILALRDLGLEIRLGGDAIGDASAIKMSYAGITKGCMAVATTMLLAAIRYGVQDTLVATLEESVPGLWAFLSSGVERMPPKAYRWIAEMQEIGKYTEAPNSAGPAIYSAASALYAHVADERATATKSEDDELHVLERILAASLAAPKKAPSKFNY